MILASMRAAFAAERARLAAAGAEAMIGRFADLDAALNALRAGA